MRVPKGQWEHWTDEMLELLLGQTATITVRLFGVEVTGQIIEARRVDDGWLGPGVWIMVESS